MRHCGESDLVEGAGVALTFTRPRFDIGGRYAFGMELERPPLPAYLAGRFDDNVCNDDLPEEDALELIDTRAHELGGHALYRFAGRFYARSGYSINLRFSGEEVHMFHLALGTRF
jgi:hypothetical protein